MLAATNYRYIVSSPGVKGGHPRIEGTRICVHSIVAYHLKGLSVDQIRECFPDLTRSQVYESLAYFEDHRTEIEPLARQELAEPAQ